MLKLALRSPALTVTFEETTAAERLEEVSVILIPPLGAAPESSTRPVKTVPPETSLPCSDIPRKVTAEAGGVGAGVGGVGGGGGVLSLAAFNALYKLSRPPL